MEGVQAKFEGWAVIEMMGHQTAIGFVTTEYFGGAALFRVDTPALPEREFTTMRPEYSGNGEWIPAGSKVKRAASQARSRLVGPQSVYALNPCTQEAALEALDRNEPRPLILIEKPKRDALPAPSGDPVEDAQEGDEEFVESDDEEVEIAEGWNGDGR